MHCFKCVFTDVYIAVYTKRYNNVSFLLCRSFGEFKNATFFLHKKFKNYYKQYILLIILFPH